MFGPALYFATGNATMLAELRWMADHLACGCDAILVPTDETGALAHAPPQEAPTWGYREPNSVSLTLAPAGVPLGTRGQRA